MATYNTNPLKLGMTGRAVSFLQWRLGLSGTNNFDVETETALKKSQRATGNQMDGVYGPMTNAALTMLHPATLTQAATNVGTDRNALAALLSVETVGRGFYTNGLPKILLERHYVYELASEAQRALLPSAVCSATPGGYAGGPAEWARFDVVAAVDADIAIRSCSWGIAQIMGDHCTTLGMSSTAWMVAHSLNEDQQISVFGHFLASQSALLAALRAHDWATVAKLYNGPDYAKNQYDTKLATAYAKLTGQVTPA